MTSVAAGSLNKLIIIEALTQTKDSSGGMVDSYSTFATVWSNVMHLSGNEKKLTAYGGQVAEARTVFKIRHLTGLTTKHRIAHDGKKYNIRHINPYNEENNFMLVTCDTGLNDGR
jgi:SPP1 family predicted phage head-tail adaptor